MIPSEVSTLWDNRVIPYCLDPSTSTEEKQIVESALKSAWGLWVTAGHKWIWIFVPGTRTNASRSSKSLGIRIDDDVMTTSIGMGEFGSTMQLVLDENSRLQETE